MKFFTPLVFLALFAVFARAIPVPQTADRRVVARDTELEARKGGGGAGDALSFGIEMAIKGISTLIANIKQDKEDRGKFTNALVQELAKKNPAFNYVVVHTKHETKFDGKQGEDWSHMHKEFDIKVGGTIGYEIYAFKSGTFIRQGDGGFLNWAFAGKIKSQSKDGKTIVFDKK